MVVTSEALFIRLEALGYLCTSCLLFALDEA